MKTFFKVRLDLYQKRKDYLEGILQAEAARLSNQARFILEKCDGTITVENKKKKDMIAELIRRGYDSDPVIAWKLTQNRDEVLVSFCLSLINNIKQFLLSFVIDVDIFLYAFLT